MRMPLQKTRRAVKVIRMKPIPVKKKAAASAEVKSHPDKDYVSETISFVIKGKLTPIKPATYVAKKVGVGPAKKMLPKKVPVKKTGKANVQQTVKKKPLSKKAKKDTESAVSNKSAKVKKPPPKTAKKSQGNATVSSASSPSSASIVNQETSKRSPVSNNPSAKSETVKTKVTSNKPSVAKKLKSAEASPEVRNKKQKKDVSPAKRGKSPQKSDAIDTRDKQKVAKREDLHQHAKKAEDIKTKQTIEKLLKQANKALKTKSIAVKSCPKKSKKAPPSAAASTKRTKLAAINKQGKAKAAAKRANSNTRQEARAGKNKQTKRKVASENSDDSSTSDNLTLNELRLPDVKTESSETATKPCSPSKSKKPKIKTEPDESGVKPKGKQKKVATKTNLVALKKRMLSGARDKVKRRENPTNRKMKLYGFWNGPKRHRVASLNALAKVHCLYENETRSNILDKIDGGDKKDTSTAIEEDVKKSPVQDVIPCTRTLRSVPGLRAVGKHWDMHDTTSSSEDNSGCESEIKPVRPAKIKKELSKKTGDSKKPEQNKRKRNRTELIMDLKDMVVRKRMASLNASAILAASYSVEKRQAKSPKGQSETEDSSDYFVTDNDDDDEDEKKCFESKVKKEDDGKVIEVRATPNKKVAVILNQDTDVTITGVYVNSTTRSTHHEGYCSIAGMQYRISATSHTQTAATAVATETLLQSSSSSTQENSNSESLQSCKSYTPLDALSNMQPPAGPGIQHGPHQHMGPPQHVLPLPQHQLSPGRRHGCPSAFSAPHAAPYPPPPPPGHHHPPLPGEPGYVHGYYQPAGPLISVPHGHTQQQQQPIAKTAPLSENSPSSASPIHQAPPPAPSSNGDSSDSEVIITSETAGSKPTVAAAPPPPLQQPPSAYRYAHQYPGTPAGYSYGYAPHYYPTPAPYAHHDLCYSTNPYFNHKYPPTTYRRYLPSAQYYGPTPDMYGAPPTGPAQQNQQVVTATPVSASGSSYQAPPSGPPPAIMEPYPPPPPTLVESYPHPTHYYPGYAPAPPPSCYTHSPTTRAVPFINATYQSCPCPMQSCPKNVLTGPLTGDSKRSNISSIAKDSMPLPPVALALPLEPASATGPPSPARGSAGMAPPPSPAGATYQPPPPPPKQESQSPEVECINPVEKKRKARIGKAMVRNNINNNNTMLLMCNPNNGDQRTFASEVKREIESPKEKEPPATELEIKASKLMNLQQTQISLSQEKDVAVAEMETPVDRLAGAENLKKEQVEDKGAKIAEPVKEELPVVSTVAENVKVKNMKRKLSMCKEKKAEQPVEPPSPKKTKTVAPTVVAKYPNGSYKDLIKKDSGLAATVKINNGRRKLLSEDEASSEVESSTNNNVNNKGVKTKAKAKKVANKRKAGTNVINKDEEATPNKRVKSQTKQPLTASNLQNSKNYSKESKSNTTVTSEPVQTENKEPQNKTKTKKGASVNNNNVSSKCSANLNNKKLAPAILDNLIAKNSVDRTIESVVSEATSATPTTPVRTNKESSALKTDDKCLKTNREPVVLNNNKKSTNKNGVIKNGVCINNNNISKVETKKAPPPSFGGGRRKSKGKEAAPLPIAKVPRRSLQQPRWSNGWKWEGDGFEAKVFLNSDETTVIRKCYPAMRHDEGDLIEPRDCVLLKAGQRKNELPFVAKIAHLWENPDDGEMMMSLLWYYRPEHTEQGRQPTDQPDEVFASRHKDSNSVACIDDKCYVLTFHEYCRFRKDLKRLEEGLESTLPCIPLPEPYPRTDRQPPSSAIPSDLIFFCRRVYDFRKKALVKNPS